MVEYYVECIDPGCECCSYITIGTFSSYEEAEEFIESMPDKDNYIISDNDCGCEHINTWFDRTFCYCVPGGTMHTICEDCGETLDGGHNERMPRKTRLVLRRYRWTNLLRTMRKEV